MGGAAAITRAFNDTGSSIIVSDRVTALYGEGVAGSPITYLSTNAYYSNVFGVGASWQGQGVGSASAIYGQGLGTHTWSSAGGAGTLTLLQQMELDASGNLTVAGVITVPSITHSGTSGTGDIGATGARFGTVWGTANSAIYADLAEKYQSDIDYEPGTVLVFGGEREVTIATLFADTAVAGVVSTAPAYLMNDEETHAVAVALRGKVPVKVIGPVRKGDLLVTSSTPGYAESVHSDGSHGVAIFAKSITEDLSEGQKVIYAVVL
jgi:hypothetical protein